MMSYKQPQCCQHLMARDKQCIAHATVRVSHSDSCMGNALFYSV